MARYSGNNLIKDLLDDVDKLLKVPVKFENQTTNTIDLRINDSFFDINASNLLVTLSKKWENRIFKGSKGLYRFGNIINSTTIRKDGPYVYLTLPFRMLSNMEFYPTFLDENMVSMIIKNLDTKSIDVLLSLKLVTIDTNRIFRYLISLQFPEEFKLLNAVYQDQSESERTTWRIIYDRLRNAKKEDNYSHLLFATPGNLGTRASIKRNYPGIYDKIDFNKIGFIDYYTDSENIEPLSIIHGYLMTGKFSEEFKLKIFDVYQSMKPNKNDLPDSLLSLIVSDKNVKFKSYVDFLKILRFASSSGTYAHRTFDALGKDKLQSIVNTLPPEDAFYNHDRLHKDITEYLQDQK